MQGFIGGHGLLAHPTGDTDTVKGKGVVGKGLRKGVLNG
ncbi:hypothetical protein JCM19237_1721 [Photobacterium aphoticum]|uniref:Uncharacterized protein n=1 Tax=Photobacterium aphoticum TaxID=754436 RepID=A0A090QT57_9GAMM|nr:hypothetical protein JCM19237_1721 [Photobacterium aphoticum]